MSSYNLNILEVGTIIGENFSLFKEIQYLKALIAKVLTSFIKLKRPNFFKKVWSYFNSMKNYWYISFSIKSSYILIDKYLK